MPTCFRVQVNLARDGAAGEDVAVNVWHFQGDEQVDTQSYRTDWDNQLPGLVARVKACYVGMSNYLSANLANTHSLKVYDLNDPRGQRGGAQRTPRFTDTFTFTPATSALPAEVAAVVSIVGKPEPGTIPSRRRGRVYIGPLAQSAMDATVGPADVIISAAARTNILGAVNTMAQGANGTPRLAIFSPTSQATVASANDTLDLAWTDAKSIYMDDAFDTIRARGAKARTRTTVTFSG